MEFWPSLILRERCSLVPVWYTIRPAGVISAMKAGPLPRIL